MPRSTPATLDLSGISSRDKILEVAEAQFARSGFTGVGLREVAAGVELSKSALFHHFSSKLELYTAVLARVLERIDAHVRPAFEARGTARERLEGALGALIDALAEQPTTARLLLRALVEDTLPPPEAQESPSIEEALLVLVQSFEALVRAGIESGEFRNVSVPDATQTVIGASVYHFASGDFGEAVLGKPLFSAETVSRRRRETVQFLVLGLVREPARPATRGE